MNFEVEHASFGYKRRGYLPKVIRLQMLQKKVVPFALLKQL